MPFEPAIMANDESKTEMKMLPEPAEAEIARENAAAMASAVGVGRAGSHVLGQPGAARIVPSAPPPTPAVERAAPAHAPMRQLQDLPRDELDHLAAEYGLDPAEHATRQALVAALHGRRQLIASMDRLAMLDVVKWARRPVPVNASKEQLAIEIVRIKTMRFDRLSQAGLFALARLRSLSVGGDETVPELVKMLRKQEGFFKRINRKRRAWIGSVVSGMLGEEERPGEYTFLPGQDAPAEETAPRSASIKEEIEEQGLFGGLASRVKKTADQYLNQKLDEIEARIDRKLDEIDRRLAEWRDKEVANRLRILKITLWASVIVAIVGLIYSYLKINRLF